MLSPNIWLFCSLLVSPALNICNYSKGPFTLCFLLFSRCKHLAIWCSPHIASTTKVYMFSWSEYGVTAESVFHYILWDIHGMLERREEEKQKIYEAPPKSQYGFQVTSTLLWRFMFNKLQVLAGWSLALGGHTHFCCQSLPTLRLGLPGRTEPPLCLPPDCIS